jgi:hypothetical protein
MILLLTTTILRNDKMSGQNRPILIPQKRSTGEHNMHDFIHFKMFGTAILSSLLLAACGGGGGSGSGNTLAASPAPAVSTPSVDGFYSGQTDKSETVTGVILADNSYFLLYSKPNQPASLSGVVFGNGTAPSGSFSSSASTDIRLNDTAIPPTITTPSVTLSASYAPKKSFNGTLSYPDNSVTAFTSNYNDAYATPPTLASLAGVYTGTLASAGLWESLTLTVQPDGTMSGPLLCDCNVSAIVQPLSAGNAYSVKIKFNDGTHLLSGQTLSGTAYLDTANKRLVLFGNLGGTSLQPAIYFGTRP